jgi:hypothetical protein
MIDFLKQVSDSDEELAGTVPFSSLVNIDEIRNLTDSNAQLTEFSSCILARACAYNINETELFLPFNLQDELVNLVEIMRHEYTAGVKIMGFDPGDQNRSGSRDVHRNGFIDHYTGRFRAMLEGTARIESVNIYNRVTAAMNLMKRPAVVSALSRLTRRPLPEYFISTQKAWITKRTGGLPAALVHQVFVRANCLAVSLLLGLVGCTRI